jgi:Domain of unknown function (DUF397)
MGRSPMPLIAGVGPIASPSSLSWRKSSHSNPSGDCLELTALAGEQIVIRCSQHSDGPALIFARAEVAALMKSAKDGEFDKLPISPLNE